jgi:mono/diheme cytochrome c family protein
VQHQVSRIVAAPRAGPLADLLGKIGRGLVAERRVGRTDPLPSKSMAACTGRQRALRIALDIQPRRLQLGHWQGRVTHGRVMGRDRVAVLRRQLLGDPAHLRVAPPPVGIGFELPLEVAALEPREPRAAGPVAEPVETMAGETGVRRARVTAAERDQLAGRGESLGRGGLDDAAGAQQRARAGDRQTRRYVGPRHLRPGTCGRGQRFRAAHADSVAIGGTLPRGYAILPLLLLAGACKPPPEERQHMPIADAARGKQAIQRVGCGSCHTISGIRWPQGKSAPPIEGMAERALIAGRVPNEPELLAAFVRNAPALVPDTTMPAMPLSEQESRDVAAYLYEIGD